VLSTFAFEFFSARVIAQCVGVLIGYENHIAATSTIAAIWSAKRRELFPSEAYASTATTSATHKNFGFIEEHAHKRVRDLSLGILEC
jgi:hypothetical protein